MTTSSADLHVDVLGMRLATPVIVGSGLITDQERNIRRLLDCGAGSVITKTIHPNPHNEKPERILRIRSGMLNSTTYSRRPVAEWCAALRRFAADGLPVIASVHADTPGELAAMCADIAATGCQALELGISCINEDGFEDTPDRVFAYADAVRRAVPLPFSVKLAVEGSTRGRVDAAVRGGAAAITLSDTIPGLAVDPQSGDIVLGDIYGYSGSGLKPIVLAEILALRRQGYAMPILASGGVQECTDIVEYLSVGSSAVQVYTALHKDMYGTLRLICDSFATWLRDRDQAVSDIVGRSLRKGPS